MNNIRIARELRRIAKTIESSFDSDEDSMDISDNNDKWHQKMLKNGWTPLIHGYDGKRYHPKHLQFAIDPKTEEVMSCFDEKKDREVPV